MIVSVWLQCTRDDIRCLREQRWVGSIAVEQLLGLGDAHRRAGCTEERQRRSPQQPGLVDLERRHQPDQREVPV